jgi:hypothetical protein
MKIDMINSILSKFLLSRAQPWCIMPCSGLNLSLTADVIVGGDTISLSLDCSADW